MSSAELQEFRLFTGGQDVDAVSGATFESTEPYEGRP